MNHLTDDQLLLAGYGELPDEQRAGAEAHLADCAECRARFQALESSRAALDWGMERKPAARARRLAWLALPLAAGIGALILVRGGEPAEPSPWRSHLSGSATAGYVAGGAALISIDSQLTRLEQGRISGSVRN